MAVQNPTTIHVSTRTPWGRAQSKTAYALGISFYDAAGHGGFRLSRQRNAMVHSAWRREGGWYEQDVDAAIVHFTFPEILNGSDQTAVVGVLRDFYPDAWEAVTGEAILPGQSIRRDERLFLESHQNDWVVVAAVSSDRHPGLVETVATKGGQRQVFDGPSVAERFFLVPDCEYRARSRFGFVIDPARHQEAPLLRHPPRSPLDVAGGSV